MSRLKRWLYGPQIESRRNAETQWSMLGLLKIFDSKNSYEVDAAIRLLAKELEETRNAVSRQTPRNIQITPVEVDGVRYYEVERHGSKRYPAVTGEKIGQPIPADTEWLLGTLLRAVEQLGCRITITNASDPDIRVDPPKGKRK